MDRPSPHESAVAEAVGVLDPATGSANIERANAEAKSREAGPIQMSESTTEIDAEPSDGAPTAPTAADPAMVLDQLVRDHLDAVYRVAYSVVRDSALAEDVAQDSLLKAWKALPSFRGESSLRSWLLRITHNTAVSTLRKRREELRDPNLLPEQPTTSSTERKVEDSLSLDAFEAALDQLDELSRAIIVLREIEGMAYDEIADVLDVPMPTVKTRILRARRVLASALEGWKS